MRRSLNTTKHARQSSGVRSQRVATIRQSTYPKLSCQIRTNRGLFQQIGSDLPIELKRQRIEVFCAAAKMDQILQEKLVKILIQEWSVAVLLADKSLLLRDRRLHATCTISC